MKLLITGANGFVGSALCAKAKETFSIIAATRAEVGEIDKHTDWQTLLQGVDVVVHLAARVHIMNDNSKDPLNDFRLVNVEGTLNLAQQAVQAGVKRFIFISSIKVNGESTLLGQPFTADDAPNPQDAYGQSKYEAELALKQLAEKTGLEVVIIRPPLVYGVGVKANFYSMMCWLNRSVPLPLGAIKNKRSLVALDNLVDLILTCTTHANAVNQTFLVSDDEDLSTTDLLRRMAKALGKKAYLLPIPSGLLEFAVRLIGKQAIAQRLCGSLQLDISKTRQLLNWTPPVSVDTALAQTARAFHS